MKTVWDDVNCKVCGLCNQKGRPSVMKGSVMCQEKQGLLPGRHIRYAHHSGSFLDHLFGWFRKKI